MHSQAVRKKILADFAVHIGPRVPHHLAVAVWFDDYYCWCVSAEYEAQTPPRKTRVLHFTDIHLDMKYIEG
jgi:hypothetical protein